MKTEIKPAPTPVLLPQGLRNDLNDIDSRAQRAKAAKANGVAMLDYLEKDVNARADVQAMRKVIGPRRWLPLTGDVHLTQGGFRAGYHNSHTRVRAVNLRCFSIEAKKAEIEASLKRYGEEGVTNKADLKGRSRAAVRSADIAGKAGLVVTAPVWGPFVVASHVCSSIKRSRRR